MGPPGMGLPPGLMGPPPSSGPDSESEMSPEEHLREALNHLRKAEMGTKSYIDSQTLDKAKVLLQSLMASREKDEEAALGGTPATRFMSRLNGR